MSNKNKITIVSLIAFLGTTGCSGLLYSGNSAPIYDRNGTSNNKTEKKPSNVNTNEVNWKKTGQVSISPVPSNVDESPIETKITNTVTDPYNTSSSIEQPLAEKQTSSNKPYGANTTNGSTVVSAGNNGFIEGETIAQNNEATPKPFENSEKVFSNDPRIQSAEQYQQEKTSNNKNPATLRPTETQPSEKEETLKSKETKNTFPENEKPSNTAVEKPKPIRPQHTEKEPIQSAAIKSKKTEKEGTGSAVKDLLKSARGAVVSGNFEKAASDLERAHRIKPGDAKILYDIAQVRFAQGKYSQAESFASKAATVAKANRMKKKIWKLLSKARKALGNSSGATSALKKANNF